MASEEPRVDGLSITWVNHASFLLRSATAGLLSDPWTTGTAFDDGWAHYSATVLTSETLDATTHVWFSHEHPDHFSPASLRTIPESDRARIEVLYQPEPEPKVLRYCERLGFATRELSVDRWHHLDSDLEVRLVPWSSGDSVLAARSGAQVVLNTNDAVISDRPAMRHLLSRLGVDHVDVLLTQFSYANWEGNEGDVERRRAAARAKLDSLRLQVEVARPRFVVPFASFIWFCHEENDYLNDAVNRVSDAVAAIEGQGIASPIVLLPGESWHVGAPHDPTAAVERYDADLAAALASGERRTSSPVSVDELEGDADRLIDQLRSINGARVIDLLCRTRVLAPADIWLSDHELAVRLGPGGLEPSDADRDHCDVALSSGALAFCLRNLYGGSTLNVNGRFRLPPHGHPARFRRWMQLTNLNNQGISVTAALPELARKGSRVVREQVRRRRSGA